MYEELIIDDIEELVATVMSDVENIDIAYRIIAKYEEASAIAKELLQYEETSAYHLEIWDEGWDGYDKEFLITIDSTLAILCEPLYQNGDYLSYDSDKVFIMDGCSQKSVADCEDGVVTVVMYADSIDDKCECACKECSFTPTAIYRVNGKEVDEKTFAEYDRVLKERIEEFENEMNLFRRMMFGF